MWLLQTNNNIFLPFSPICGFDVSYIGQSKAYTPIAYFIFSNEKVLYFLQIIQKPLYYFTFKQHIEK